MARPVPLSLARSLLYKVCSRDCEHASREGKIDHEGADVLCCSLGLASHRPALIRIRQQTAWSTLWFLISVNSSLAADTDWPAYGSDAASTKYAPLHQINAENVAELVVAWTWESPDNALGKFPGPFKSTPIKVGDTLYVSTSLGYVAAIDAVSGQQRWLFATDSWKRGNPPNLGFNHRGVAYWEEGETRRILMPTNDAYLWSLDANTGKPDRRFGDDGRIDLTEGLSRPVRRRMYSVISPPQVVGDLAIVGSSVSDHWSTRRFTDYPPGDVRAFDIRTGELRWTFRSVPRPEEIGHETWLEDSWKDGGSINVWTLMSADHELGYVYLPFGTPSNDWYGGHRPGDNLFGESLVCLEAATGKLVWYFQTVHHGLWDYDLPAAPNLVDIEVEGRAIKAVAQITKQGFVFVLDRVTGEPVWPIEERPVPQSRVPGERTSATQPFPTRPAPFEHQGISLDNLIDYSPELRAETLEIIGQYEYGPLYTPPSLKGTIEHPGDGGGAEWSGAAFDPETSRLYIPSQSHAIVVKLEQANPRSQHRYQRTGPTTIQGPGPLPLTKPPHGRISALNLNSGEYDWVVPNGDGLRQYVIDRGAEDPGPVGSVMVTFPLLTKSLLFLIAPDTGGHYLNAIHKETGEFIHKVPIPWSYAAPMTYLAGGRQYIVFARGARNQAGLTALALTSDQEPTDSAVGSRTMLSSRKPKDIYLAICARCHDDAVQGAPRPGHPGDWELRLREGIDAVVNRTIEGMLPHMPARGLCDECTDEEVRAVVEFMLEGIATAEAEEKTGRDSPDLQ